MLLSKPLVADPIDVLTTARCPWQTVGNVFSPDIEELSF